MRLVALFVSGPAPSDTYTLSLHDALPISQPRRPRRRHPRARGGRRVAAVAQDDIADAAVAVLRAPEEHAGARSEEHTSELQSLAYLVCRLLLEKKNEASCRVLAQLRL